MTSDTKDAQLKAAKKRYAKLKKERNAAANSASSRDQTPIEEVKSEEETRQESTPQESQEGHQPSLEKHADQPDHPQKQEEGQSLEEELSVPGERVEKVEQQTKGAQSTLPIDNTTASLVAELREDNENLRLKVEALTTRIKSLESENEFLRSDRPREISLSPPPIQQRHGRQKSIIGADLYSERANIGTIADKMKKWQGWQLDLREWRLIDLGPKVAL